jgi:hypothetical protein
MDNPHAAKHLIRIRENKEKRLRRQLREEATAKMKVGKTTFNRKPEQGNKRIKEVFQR